MGATICSVFPFSGAVTFEEMGSPLQVLQFPVCLDGTDNLG
jgi:hypothetical protein